jgi:class 3 adenylate cyclase
LELHDASVRGIAVHIGARVAALAGPSEILVSSTVKDLVAGSGLASRMPASTSLRASRTAGGSIG